MQCTACGRGIEPDEQRDYPLENESGYWECRQCAEKRIARYMRNGSTPPTVLQPWQREIVPVSERRLV